MNLNPQGNPLGEPRGIRRRPTTKPIIGGNHHHKITVMDSDRAELLRVVHLLAIEVKHLLLQRHLSLATHRHQNQQCEIKSVHANPWKRNLKQNFDSSAHLHLEKRLQVLHLQSKARRAHDSAISGGFSVRGAQ